MLCTLWYSVDYSIVPYGLAHKRRTSPNCKVSRILLQELVVTGSRKFELIKPVLRDLKLIVFLSVQCWQNYTVGTLTFKCVKGLAPRYLFFHFVTRATAHDQNTRKKNKIIRYFRTRNLVCCWAVIFSLQISNYVELITHCYMLNIFLWHN